MEKWYADNTELSTTKGKSNVLIFGGIIIDAEEERKLKKIICDVKEKYTLVTLPVKWNFKDLKDTYLEFDRMEDYQSLLKNSYEWRKEIFEKSLDINYKVVLACTERYASKIPLGKMKEELTSICFVQALTRVAMYAKHESKHKKFEIILDWPDSSNPKPFNREFFRAYNFGESSKNVRYFSGPLSEIGFIDTLYYAKSTHSTMLQFADLVIGACKEYILKNLHEFNSSLGYDLTNIILHKYRGYPNKVLEYGMNYAPKGVNYEKLKSLF